MDGLLLTVRFCFDFNIGEDKPKPVNTIILVWAYFYFRFYSKAVLYGVNGGYVSYFLAPTY